MAKELNEYILEQANANGICDEWASLIQQASSKDEMMEMYIKGIDFCLEHNFPSNDDLLKYMGDAGLAHHGVYIDCKTVISNLPILVTLGACVINGQWNDYTTGQVYVKGISVLHAEANNNAFLVIDCFDNSKLKISASGDSKVLVNVYGSAAVSHTQSENAMVKIVHKLKSSY